MEPNEAFEKLAWHLHRKMEHLDPTDDPEWEDLHRTRRIFIERAYVRFLWSETYCWLLWASGSPATTK